MWKYKSVILIDFVCFYRKISNKTLCLTRKYQKLSFVLPSCWIATIVWNVLRQWKYQGRQKYEIFCPRKLWRVYMLHASMLNSLEPNHSLCSTDLHQVNPVDTTIAAIIAVGLRDKQITISFAKIIYRKKKKFKKQEQLSHYLLNEICSNENAFTQSFFKIPA